MGIVNIVLLVVGLILVIIGAIRLANRSWVDGAIALVIGLVVLGVGGFIQV